jgi:hypothetical protein
MLKISLIGFGRIILNQRFFTIGIGIIEPIQLSQYHCLNDREAFFSPIFEVQIRLLTIQSVKQLPCRITQPEKRLPIPVNNVPLIFTHF